MTAMEHKVWRVSLQMAFLWSFISFIFLSDIVFYLVMTSSPSSWIWGDPWSDELLIPILLLFFPLLFAYVNLSAVSSFPRDVNLLGSGVFSLLSFFGLEPFVFNISFFHSPLFGFLFCFLSLTIFYESWIQSSP